MKRFFQLLLLSAGIEFSVCSGSAQLVSYSYTGTTASLDSTITAWFQFDSSAMLDRGVRFTEILQYDFQVTGSDTDRNGHYDLLLGGGIGFGTTSPGPSNLPVIQSLVIYNSLSQTIMMSDNLGDPAIFVGGTAGTGPPIYSGQWSYAVVPEPSVLALGGMAVLLFRLNFKKGRLVETRS